MFDNDALCAGAVAEHHDSVRRRTDAAIADRLQRVYNRCDDAAKFVFVDAGRNAVNSARRCIRIVVPDDKIDAVCAHDSIDFNEDFDSAFAQQKAVHVVVCVNAELLFAAFVVVAHPKRRVFIVLETEEVVFLDVFQLDLLYHIEVGLWAALLPPWLIYLLILLILLSR